MLQTCFYSRNDLTWEVILRLDSKENQTQTKAYPCLPFSEATPVQFLAQGSLGRYNIAHLHLISLAKKIQLEVV